MKPSASGGIALCTINARYQHASLGLRYLYANAGEWQTQIQIIEFVSGTKTEVLVEKLLDQQPKLIGFGVYIWNVDEISALVSMLKAVAPEITIVLGGPEVSYPPDQPAVCKIADYTICGQADLAFKQLLDQIFIGPKPLQKLIQAPTPDPLQLRLPYGLYSPEDIANRFIYVEASRGCPFKCEFCLSSLDKTAVPFDLNLFLDQLQNLYDRGARQFKFVDRTFNLNIKASKRILDFFLDKIAANPNDPVFAHFELIPDHLPPALKETIAKFPAGTLQFEIGIQSFNPQVQERISRKQNDDKARENIQWLMRSSHAHLHVDLIAGLPGESADSFGAGLNRLMEIGPHEIQLGILKRLRGTPITRHTEAFAMRYNPNAPYNLLANSEISFSAMQNLSRFARYWNLIVNSGRFNHTKPLILAENSYQRFAWLTQWLYEKTDATHKIAHDRLVNLVAQWLLHSGADPADVERTLAADAIANGRAKLKDKAADSASHNAPARQTRHLQPKLVS
jgi:radical SAM superfamily enzyme YgiQ (UPF0313 family)